jgi:ribose transport system permease protein
MTKVTAKSIREIVKTQGLLLALVVILLVFSLGTKAFLSVNNLILILKQVSIVGIIACAMTYVIIAGNLDLTVGSLVSMATLVSVSLHDKFGPLMSIVVPLIVGVASGAICGYIVGYLKLNSLIVTLGMLSILHGTTMLYSGGGVRIIAFPEKTWFGFLGRGVVFGIPFQVILYAVSIFFFQLILKRTVFGKQMMAVGGNANASRYTGINDRKTVLITFILSGFMSALAGVILASRVMQVQPKLGVGYEFDVITGVILGGTSLLGGEGSVVKTFLGVLILGVLQNGFIMIGLPYYSQWIVQCIVIVLVVWLDITSRRSEAAV